MTFLLAPLFRLWVRDRLQEHHRPTPMLPNNAATGYSILVVLLDCWTFIMCLAEHCVLFPEVTCVLHPYFDIFRF